MADMDTPTPEPTMGGEQRGKVTLTQTEIDYARDNAWGKIAVSREYGQTDVTYEIVLSKSAMPTGDVEQLTTYGKKSFESNRMTDKAYYAAVAQNTQIMAALAKKYREVEDGTCTDIYVRNDPDAKKK